MGESSLFIKFGLRAFGLMLLAVILTVLSAVLGFVIGGYSNWDLARAALYGSVGSVGLIAFWVAGITWPLDKTISLLGIEPNNE